MSNNKGILRVFAIPMPGLSSLVDQASQSCDVLSIVSSFTSLDQIIVKALSVPMGFLSEDSFADSFREAVPAGYFEAVDQKLRATGGSRTSLDFDIADEIMTDLVTVVECSAMSFLSQMHYAPPSQHRDTELADVCVVGGIGNDVVYVHQLAVEYILGYD